MSVHEIDTLLRELVDQPGLIACALVDVETGMVCQCAGDGEQGAGAGAPRQLGRGPVRPGRVRPRALGPTRAQVLIHDRARLTLARCGEGLLLVCISHEPDRVDWLQWKQAVGSLQALACRT